MKKKALGLVFFFASFQIIGQDIQESDIFKILAPNSLITCEIEKSNIFLVGETHDIKGNFFLQNHFLNFFIRTNKKLIVLIELPFNRENIINNYLTSGNSKYLEILAEDNPKIKDELIEAYSFFRKIRLETNNFSKIEFKCVDIANSKQNIISNLFLFLDENYPELKPLEDFIKIGNKRWPSKKKLKKTLMDLNNDLLKNPDRYKTYFENNFFEFNRQVNASLIYLSGVSTKNSEGLEKREEFLYENISRIISENPNAFFFGNFGIAHIPITYQKSWLHLKNWNSLAARLNTNHSSPVRGRVCSIATFYTSAIDQEYKNYVEPFVEYTTTPITLFKICGENTPYKEMSEKFQYLIINKYEDTK